jgi:predicted Zn finger-like uncharacterized protein
LAGAVPFTTQCAHCQAKYRVPDNSVGKRATCTKCGKEFTVAQAKAGDPQVVDNRTQPSVAAAPAGGGPVAAPPKPGGSRPPPPRSPEAATAQARPAPSADETSALTARELESAFTGSLPRTGPNLAYRLGTVLVALAMLVLPLIYLAIIVLLGFGVYYHARYDTALAEMGYGRARLMFISLYLAPLIAGPIAVFFMLKPLLARPIRHDRYRSVTRKGEPLLFAFVDQVCKAVGSPKPRRIDVDCLVNASAHFRRGLISMLGDDLVLTVGLPLVGGLTLREFGGVLAHELGHFAQGTGMRLTYIVRSIINWFVRVVYQRDQWDEWLEQAVQSYNFRISWIFLIAHLFVLLGRGILWALLHVGLAIAGLMLRQMEYDADRYQARLAGSDAFASTMRKLHVLDSAAGFAEAQLRVALQRRQLVDDLPGLITVYARNAPPEAWRHVEKQIAESKTGWLDSHPSPRERLAAAERLASPGILHLEMPAAALFTDFGAQAVAATWDLYCAVLGPNVPRSALQPIEQFVAAEWTPV